ncbi:HD domain-containing protein, partial [Acidianus ambivalens]|nr:HD domain-containing protein [Acidianus ambivalens]
MKKTIRGVYLNGVKITEEEKNREAREELKHLVVRLMLASGGGDVDLLTDYLSLIIKAPLLLPYMPYSGNSLLNNFDFLTSYIAIRRNKYIESGKELLESSNITPRSFIEILYGGDKVGAYQSLRKIFEALSTTPADTRPGLNIAPLSSHLTLTSLIGWLEQPYSKDLPYLRLASILHDIGKLTSPSHHLTEGIKFMEEVIEELKKENVEVENLENALHLIETHHSKDDSIVKRADGIASSVDRLIKEVKEIIPSIEGCKPFLSCYEPGAKAECMEQIKYDEKDYTMCTEKLYKALHEKKKGEERKEEVHDVKGYLYFVDFPGVQSFINYFSNLRDLSAASFLVDFLSSTVPFLHLDNLHRGKAFLPPEALLSSMGGHSYLVGRADVNPEEFIETLKEDEIFKELDVTLKVSYVPFYYDGHVIQYDSLEDVIRKSNLNSLLLNFKEEVLSYGLHKVCDSCGIRPAVYLD